MVCFKFNSAKNKILSLNNPSTSQVSIADQQIERVNDFQYLGRIVSSEKIGTELDVSNRNGKAKAAFGIFEEVKPDDATSM